MNDFQLLVTLRANAEEVLSSYCSIEAVHRHVSRNEPYDKRLWQEIAELGWTSLTVPEVFGGLGAGIRELAVLQKALGSRLAPIPFVGTAIVCEALVSWPFEAPRSEILPAIAAGKTRGGVGPIHQPATTALTATEFGRGVQISGECSGIVDGSAADWLLLPVRNSDGDLGVALIPTAVSNCKIANIPVADRTRDVSTISFPSVTLGDQYVVFGKEAVKIISRCLETASLMIASDSIGGADTIFNTTIDWLKTRTQFSKPIGSFQALKHRAADSKVMLEMAAIVVQEAVDLSEPASLNGCWPAIAKVQACEAYTAIAADAIQMHGGMGFTWEHQAHFHLKRATLNRQLFGNSKAQMDHIAAVLMAEIAA